MALVVSPAMARAQSAQDLQTATLEDLLKITVTTASRHAEGVGDAPAQVDVITARQIQERGYRSLGELLRDQLGIKVELGTDPDYPSDVTVLGSRGTGRVVLLMDGIRVMSPTGEPLPIMANYPIHHARQVEIVYGPASALYGADAFSAVINVISQDASELDGFGAGVSIGSFGLSNHTARYGRRVGANGSLVLSGQWFRDAQPDLDTYYPELFRGMEAQRVGMFNSIFGPMAAASAVSSEFQNPIAAHSFQGVMTLGSFQLSFFQNRQRASTSSPYTPDNAAYDQSAFQQNDLWVGAGSYTRKFGSLASTSTITVSEHTLSPQSGYFNVFSNFRKSFKYAYGSMIKGEQQVSWSLTRKTTVTAGVTYEHFFSIPQGADLNEPVTSHDTPGTILDTDIVDEFVKMQYSNTGVFAQVQYAPTPRVSLTAGTRADYNSRYGGTLNPRLGAVLKPRAGTSLKLLFGSAFLAPSPYESTSHFGSFYSADGGQTYASDFWHLGNPDLKPQKEYTLQASATQSLGSLVSVSVTGFSSRMKDVIKHADEEGAGPGFYHGWPVAWIESPINEGHEAIYGATVDTHFLKSWSSTVRLQAQAGISLIDGYVHEDDHTSEAPIGGIAPAQFRSGVDLELGRWTTSASLMAFGRQRVLALADDGSRRTLPGFAVVNVNLRRNRITRNLDAFVRVENLFDARYFDLNVRAYSSAEELAGSPQGPRRISVGFDVRVGR